MGCQKVLTGEASWAPLSDRPCPLRRHLPFREQLAGLKVGSEHPSQASCSQIPALTPLNHMTLGEPLQLFASFLSTGEGVHVVPLTGLLEESKKGQVHVNTGPSPY